MQTRKTAPATGSDIIHIKLPQSWQMMTQKQLTTFYRILSQHFPLEEAKVHCFMIFSGIRVITRIDDMIFFCSHGKRKFMLNTVDVTCAAKTLDFLLDIPAVPIRLERVGKYFAYPADFSGVPFKIWLSLENFYQGYLATEDNQLLLQMAKLMYHNDDFTCEDYVLISVFYWFSSLKRYFSIRFSHFFQPFDESCCLEQKTVAQRLQDSMDSQIRALTKGDVTREAAVLDTDTLRALTELNALAKEYEELQKMKS